MRQRTIAEKISCTGIGLHTGVPVHLTLHPARANSGIVFVRNDYARPVEIPVCLSAVVATNHATTLGRGDATVGTVEHLLAALYAIGIDNLRVEIDGPEVPIMDGSAAPFIHLVRMAGIYEQPEERRTLRIRRPIEIREGEKWIRVSPARNLRVSYSIDFAHPSIGRQEVNDLLISEKTFASKIGRARTFGFRYEVEALKAAGLARGGSLANAVVLDERGVMNEEGLRFKDEFISHKVVDLIGDLSLLGVRLCGHIQVHRGGHALHAKLAKAIVEVERRGRLDDAIGYETFSTAVSLPSTV